MPGDPEITDQELGSEIELLADVITAAGDSDETLSQEQIDNALGVCPDRPEEEPVIDGGTGHASTPAPTP